MSRWFRFYDEALNDPKVQRLPGDMFKAWVNILCLASKGDGYLPPIEDIAFALRITDEEVGEILESLEQRHLLDEFDGKLRPHNWEARQHKSDHSTERVRKHRSMKQDETVSETKTKRSRTEQSRTDTEQKDSEANASGADAPDDEQRLPDPEPVDDPPIPDPAEPEREYFARGREILGSKAGGLLAKLLKAKGGNVALARSTLELASTKQTPVEFIGAACRGPPAAGQVVSIRDEQRMKLNAALDRAREYADKPEDGGALGGPTLALIPQRGRG